MKLINLFTFIVLCISQIHSGVDIDHEHFVSLPEAKPVAIKLKVDAEFLAPENSAILENLCREVSCSRFRICNPFIIGRSGASTDFTQPNLFVSSLVTIERGLIYQGGEILNADYSIYALNAYGQLCIAAGESCNDIAELNHDLFFRRDGFRFALPVACAGHMKVKNGKISEIDRASGHFFPATLQLVLAVSYLNDRGVIAEDVVLNGSSYSSSFTSLGEVLSIASTIELG